MPQRPKRPCSRCRRALTRDRFCETCGPINQREYDAARGSSAERGYSGDWPTIRTAHLAREPFCRECGAEATHVDHIVPRRQFTDQSEANRSTNLQSLCPPCHSRKTAREDGGFGNPRGVMRESATGVPKKKNGVGEGKSYSDRAVTARRAGAHAPGLET